MRDIANVSELEALVGSEIGVSRWFEVTQQRIGTFADATDDHQWIHIDADRAARESPFGGTVAHGFLTLSLLPAMLEDTITMSDVAMAINYGLDRVRFPAPVPANSRVRGRIELAALDKVEGGAQLRLNVTVEREGGGKPACVAQFLIRRYP
jgi:acyl dehydratase